MDPLLKSLLGSFFRWFFTFTATWLVSRGVLTTGDATELITGATALLVTLAWALITRYRSRIKLLTALDSPAGTTLAEVNEKIKAGNGATLAGAQ